MITSDGLMGRLRPYVSPVTLMEVAGVFEVVSERTISDGDDGRVLGLTNNPQAQSARYIIDGYIHEGAQYMHDCGSCIFLGTYKKCDMYWCGIFNPAEPNKLFGPTISVRYSSEGSDYSSGLVFAKYLFLRKKEGEHLSDDAEAFAAAYLLSIARGFLPRENGIIISKSSSD